MTDTKLMYSSNDDEFRCDSLDALIEADGLSEGDAYFVAPARNLCSAKFAAPHEVDGILEHFDDALFEHVGEISDADFASVTPAAREELQQLLSAWIDKHVNVGRYWVTDASQRLLVTAQDMEGHDHD